MNQRLYFFRRYWPLFVFLTIFVVCIGYGYIIWGTEWTLENNRGKFGDSFGALNTLFAGLAFAGVIWAILLQREELEHQRTELKDQKEILQKQNFESSFFQLFGLHNEIVNSIKFSSTVDNQPITYSGRDYFIYALRQLNDGADRNAFFDEHQSHVGRYFSHFYNIIKFVDQQSDDIIKKSFYVDLIRAQMSTAELGVLSFHRSHETGAEFKILIEKYALLKDLSYVPER